jgi:pSer/pThr/pTyr-binding forkhead associated (FHA) protein
MKLELVSTDRDKAPIVLDQFPVIVGFDRTADVCLDDSSVGHYQCMIDDSDGVLTVYDLGTRIGTMINGARISKKATLIPGDELSIGKNCFRAYYGERSKKLDDSTGRSSPRHRRTAVPV